MVSSTTSSSANPSFHFRIGEELPIAGGGAAPPSEYGHPDPGVQSPTPHDATAPNYFVNKAQWAEILNHGHFDDIVVGSGFCALAYVSEALKRDPSRKILVLERGGDYYSLSLIAANY